MHLAPGIPSRERVHEIISLIRRGNDAEEMETGDVSRGYLIHLPLYAVDGNVRLRWSSPYVFIAEELPVTLTVRAWDRSHQEVLADITIDSSQCEIEHDQLGTIRVSKRKFSSRHELAALISHTVSEGTMAVWDAITELEEPIEHFVCQWNMSLAAQQNLEIGGVLGAEDRARVTDEVVLGVKGVNSPLIRLLHRLAGDVKDGSGDARQYLIKNMRRDALDAVRRAAGESRHGDLVRRTAKQIGTKDHQEVLQAVKRDRPNLTIGINVVKHALATSHSPHANSVPLEEAFMASSRNILSGEVK